ncbi:MAG: TonB-dependent receptor [Pirellulaceae bacterium]
MFKRLLASAALAAATTTAPALPRLDAQDLAPIVSESTALRIAQDTERPTLPPVEVRPEVMPDTTEPPVVDSFTADQSPTFNPNVSDVYSQSFPSLSNQIIGGVPLDTAGLNSILRSEQSLFDAPQLATIVDRQELDERMATSMFRALQKEVGVTLQQTGNGQLSPFIRGLTGQQILILVDGIRLNNSVLRPGPNQYAATFDPGMIERIEVVRGSQSVMWGSDAIGGAINIVTRSANPMIGDYSRVSFQEYAATANASSYSRANVEGWVGGSGVFAGASYFNVNEVDRGGGLGPQPGTDYSQYAGDIKYNKILGDNVIMTIALQHFEQLDLPRSDRFLPFVLGPAPNGSSGTQRPTFFDQQRNLAYLRFQGIADVENLFYDAFSTTVSYSLTKEGNDESRFNNNTPAATRTRLTQSEFRDDMIGANVILSKDNGDFGKIVYGADYYYEDIDAYRFRTNNPDNPGATPQPDTPQYPDDSRADRIGTFISWEVNLTQRLSASAGVRYENLDLSATPDYDTIGPFSFTRSYQDWIGSVGLGYEVTNDLKLVGGVYEGFRAPTIDDLTGNKTALQNVQSVPRIGDLGIDPEHSYTYEVGVKYDGDRVRFQVFEWWNDFRSVIGREIVTVNGQDFDFLANQRAYLNGTEAYGEYLFNPYWSVYGNFAYTFGKNLDTNDPFSRIPPTQGILGVRWRDTARQSYVDFYTWLVRRQERYSQFNQGDVRFIPGGTPGYGTLNLRAGTALGRHQNHRVSIALENITDKYYRVLGSGVDGTGFNAIFGYELIH